MTIPLTLKVHFEGNKPGNFEEVNISTLPVEFKVTKRKASYRQIAIPKREHGYSNFKSQVIKSQADLDLVLNAKKTMGWNNFKDFKDGIEKAKIDFSKEALVLLRHTEGSGSVAVTFETPLLKKDVLHCKITRKAPEVGTADMAYYCFALAVNKTNVRKIKTEARNKTLELILPKLNKKNNGKSSSKIPLKIIHPRGWLPPKDAEQKFGKEGAWVINSEKKRQSLNTLFKKIAAPHLTLKDVGKDYVLSIPKVDFKKHTLVLFYKSATNTPTTFAAKSIELKNGEYQLHIKHERNPREIYSPTWNIFGVLIPKSKSIKAFIHDDNKIRKLLTTKLL